MSMKTTMTFDLERETKNAVRFQERVESEVQPPKVGTLYVQKATFAEHGSIPQSITVTIEVN